MNCVRLGLINQTPTKTGFKQFKDWTQFAKTGGLC